MTSVPFAWSAPAVTSVAKRFPLVLRSGKFCSAADTQTTALTGARTDTRTGSSSRSTSVPPRGATLDESTTRCPESERSGRSGSTRTGTTSDAVSASRRANSVYRGDAGVGTGRYARNVPLGATVTGAPLIVSDARPLPNEPKMKLESRTGMGWFADGKTTLGTSGPSTGSTAGNGGAGRGLIPRAYVRGGVGPVAGVGCVGRETDWQPAAIARIARLQLNGKGRMRVRNVGRRHAKPLGHSSVQFIDHPSLGCLYSRLMEVFAPEAHA